MKAGKNLVELATEIQRRANAKRDMVATTTAMVVHAEPEGVILRVGDNDFGMNGVAHDQVGGHTEIPAKYYDRMLRDEPNLLAVNINTWFNRFPAKRMVRTMDGTARAFLSDRYRPLENEELAEVVLPRLMELDLEVMSSEITDRRLYIKAVDKRVVRELEAKGGKFGDGQNNIVRCLAPAITVSNSEVGMGALSVMTGVYDGFCSNLATFGERSKRVHHLGGRHELGGEDFREMLSDDTMRKTNEALFAQIGDVVAAAFDRARFDALCDKISETSEHKIDGDPVKVISLASKKLGMTEAEGKSILTHLIEGGSLSRFGLYNAITRSAQDIEDYDRATQLERIGGQLIELAPRDWKELAAAA